MVFPGSKGILLTEDVECSDMNWFAMKSLYDISRAVCVHVALRNLARNFHSEAIVTGKK